MKKLIITESQFQRLVKNLAEKRSKLNESVLNEDSEQDGSDGLNYNFSVEQKLASAVTEIPEETIQEVSGELSQLINFIERNDAPILKLEVLGMESKVTPPDGYEIGDLAMQRAINMAVAIFEVLSEAIGPEKTEIIFGKVSSDDLRNEIGDELQSDTNAEIGPFLVKYLKEPQGPEWDEGTEKKDDPKYTEFQRADVKINARQFYYESLASKLLGNDVEQQLKAFGEGKGGIITWKGKNWPYYKFIPVWAFQNGFLDKNMALKLNQHLTKVLKPAAPGATGNQIVKGVFKDAFKEGKADSGYRLDTQWMPKEVQDAYMRAALKMPDGVISWADRTMRMQ